MARFFLVRHGITTWIERGILHGAADIPLSDAGRAQAELTAAALRPIEFDQVVASPLSRAMETAQIICRGRDVAPAPLEGLREMNFGFIEGKRDLWRFVKKRRALILPYLLLRSLSGLVSGESLRHFLKRVVDSWEAVKSAHPQGQIGLVAHAGVLRAILVHEFGGPFMTIDRFSTLNCSITELDVTIGGITSLIRLNDVAHLDGKVSG